MTMMYVLGGYSLCVYVIGVVVGVMIGSQP